MRQTLPHFLGAAILVLTTYSGQAQVLNNSVNIEIQPKQIEYNGVGDGANNPADINIMGTIRLNNNFTTYNFPCLQYDAGTTTSFPHMYTNTSGNYFVSQGGLPFNTTLSRFQFIAMENDHTHCVHYTDATSPSGNGDDDFINPVRYFSGNSSNITAFLKPAGFWDDNYGITSDGWFQNGAWKYKIRTTWRFEHGNTCSDPLNFGTIGLNDFRGDNNSTAFDPTVETQSSGQVDLVYTNEGGSRITRDVWYKFTLDNTCNVQISTDNNVTGSYDTYLTLYSDCNTVIKTNDDVGNAGSNSYASLISTKLCPGTYYIAVEGYDSDNNFGLTITTGPSLPDLTAQVQSTSHVTCNGGMDGSVVMGNISGGTGTVTSQIAGEDMDALPAGTYDVVVTDENQCTFTQEVVITEPNPIIFTTQTTDVSCFGLTDGSVQVTNVAGGNGGYSYSIPNESMTALEAGSYDFIVTDQDQCTQTQQIVITEPDPITFTAQTTDVSCFGFTDGSVQATDVAGGNGGYSYSIVNESINALEAGSYDFIVEDALGCSANETIVISEPSELIVSGTTTPETTGSDGSIDASVNGGTAPYNFNWSNSSTTEDLVDITSGLYTLTVTDANGCTTSEDFTVTSTIGLSETTIEASVYPNPTSGEVTIELNGEFRYKLTDTAGKVIFSGRGNNTELLYLTALQSGLYTLLLEVQDMMIVKKIVKK